MTVNGPSKQDEGVGQLLLKTLGGGASLQRISAGSTQEVLGPGKPLALVTYLALTPRKTAMREELIDLLWANAPDSRARATLRQTLSQLRSQLGEDAIETVGKSVTLRAAVVADAVEFSRAFEAGRNDLAISLFSGPFLPDLSFPGGASFELWAEGERARLAGMHRRACDAEVRHALSEGRARDAVVVARALRDSDRLRESSWRLLLEALGSAGDVVGLSVEVDAFERLLHDEELEPEQATLSAIHRARNMAAVREGPNDQDELPLQADLVGREREFALLMDCFRRSVAGGKEHVHLAGQPGIGKTRLLSDFAQRLRAKGTNVIYVRANFAQRAVAFGLAADIAVALSRVRGAAALGSRSAGVLVDLAPSLATGFQNHAVVHVTGPDTLLRRSLALSDLLETIAGERPISLLLDDVQWADAASRDVIAGLLHRQSSRCLIVTSSRLGLGISSPDSNQLTLQGLNAGAITALFASIGLAVSQEDVSRLLDLLLETSGGSPHAILETLQLALDQGVLVREVDSIRLSSLDAFERLVREGDATIRRLQSVSGERRRILDLLSIFGKPIHAGQLCRLAALDASAVDRAIVDLVAHRLVVDAEEGWTVHDAIAEKVVNEIPPSRRREIEEQIAYRLAAEATGDADFRLAISFVLGAGMPERAAPMFNTWLTKKRQAGDGRSARVLARELISDDTRSGDFSLLLNGVRWWNRPPVWTRRVGAATAVALIATALVIPRWLDTPVLSVAVPPILATSIDTGMPQLQPTPVIELRDRRGSRITSPDTISVRVKIGAASIGGTLRAPVLHGRAAFPDLRFKGDGPVLLQFVSEKSGQTVTFAFENRADEPIRLQLLSASLNGSVLSTEDPVFVTEPNRSVSAAISVGYSSGHPNATMVYAASPTWGNPKTAVISIGSVSTPAVDRQRLDTIRFVTPKERGVYHIVLAIGAETNAEFLFSRTNWKLGKPDWDDGNELARLPPDSLELAMTTGGLTTYIARLDSTGRRVKMPDRVGLTAIRINVQ